MDRRRALLQGAGLGLTGLSAGWVSLARAADLDLRRQGAVLLIRHAQTEPGIGDPPGFQLGVCATQRNLSEGGRQQARALGPLLAARGLAPQRVRNSTWCRCVDTAQLAFGQSEAWPALNSFFEGRGSEPGQTAQLRAALESLPAGRVEAWVTHQVNISALTGEGVAMGEVLVVRGGSRDARVVQRLGV